jgi:hypothetical protein
MASRPLARKPPLAWRKASSKGRHYSRVPGVLAATSQSFHQTMLMIIKAFSVMPRFWKGFQAIEIKQVKFCLQRSRGKKGGLNLKVSLQKLLKTHIEKMSTFEPEQKLLKTQQVKVFLKLYR